MPYKKTVATTNLVLEGSVVLNTFQKYLQPQALEGKSVYSPVCDFDYFWSQNWDSLELVQKKKKKSLVSFRSEDKNPGIFKISWQIKQRVLVTKMLDIGI